MELGWEITVLPGIAETGRMRDCQETALDVSLDGAMAASSARGEDWLAACSGGQPRVSGLRKRIIREVPAACISKGSRIHIGNYRPADPSRPCCQERSRLGPARTCNAGIFSL